MRSSKVCLKCGGSDIIVVEGYVGAYGSGNYIQAGVFSTTKVDRYVCCSCGYAEEWI